MEHVAGPIHRVPLGFVSAYLVDSAEGGVLVDTGVPGRSETLLAAARELSPVAGPHGLHRIVVTHCHVDHAGGLAAVAAASGVPVLAHRLDAPVIRAGGPQPPAIPEGRVARLLSPLFGRVGPRRLEPAPVHGELEDGASAPGGLRVIHTPGHTPGHLSLLWPEEGGVLIAGDAAGRMFGRLGLAVVNAEPAIARRTFARLAELEFDVACVGHGPVLRGRANAAFRRRVEAFASKG